MKRWAGYCKRMARKPNSRRICERAERVGREQSGEGATLPTVAELGTLESTTTSWVRESWAALL